MRVTMACWLPWILTKKSLRVARTMRFVLQRIVGEL